jgi:hypothetical protein
MRAGLSALRGEAVVATLNEPERAATGFATAMPRSLIKTWMSKIHLQPPVKSGRKKI